MFKVSHCQLLKKCAKKNRMACTCLLWGIEYIRMEIGAKANNRRLFFGENGGSLRDCVADEFIRAGQASVS